MRFQKRIGFGPFSLNLSKGGVSLSAGVRGAHVNYDLSGRRRNPRVTLGIPGTGISESFDVGNTPLPQPPHEVAGPTLSQTRMTIFVNVMFAVLVGGFILAVLLR